MEHFEAHEGMMMTHFGCAWWRRHEITEDQIVLYLCSVICTHSTQDINGGGLFAKSI